MRPRLFSKAKTVTAAILLGLLLASAAAAPAEAHDGWRHHRGWHRPVVWVDPYWRPHPHRRVIYVYPPPPVVYAVPPGYPPSYGVMVPGR
jgi:hypothetical protein